MKKDNIHGHKCCKCGSTADYIRVIDDRGYGSAFDNFETITTIPVCNECGKELKEEWFAVQPQKVNEHIFYWSYEDLILNFIKSLDEETQHKVLIGFFI